jgi:hypothetical protein
MPCPAVDLSGLAGLIELMAVVVVAGEACGWRCSTGSWASAESPRSPCSTRRGGPCRSTAAVRIRTSRVDAISLDGTSPQWHEVRLLPIEAGHARSA